MGTIGNGQTTSEKELAVRQSFSPDILPRYELRCALHPDTTWAPDSSSAYLTHQYCSSWFACQPDGKKPQIPHLS